MFWGEAVFDCNADDVFLLHVLEQQFDPREAIPGYHPAWMNV
jgi:hypothetical protein